MSRLYQHLVSYDFNGQRRQHQLEVELATLPAHVAALHLLQLHFGDAENNFIMPPSDAPTEEVLAQAGLLGISRIGIQPLD